MAKWGEIKCPRCAELEAKLAKLTKAADRVHDSYWYSSDGIIVGMHDLSEALHQARTTLAELKGQGDE
jgi:phage FluMu protein Com